MESRNKFCVPEHVLFHPCVFATDRAVYHSAFGIALFYLASSSWRDGAVDESKLWSILSHVICRCSDKAVERKRVAHMQNRARFIQLDWLQIDTNALVRATQDLI